MAQRFDRGHWPAAGENTRLINYAPSPGAGQSRGLWNVVPQLQLTILSRSCSMSSINLPKFLRLFTINISSSVMDDPMHSKLNSVKLMDNVRWARDKAETRDRYTFD